MSEMDASQMDALRQLLRGSGTYLRIRRKEDKDGDGELSLANLTLVPESQLPTALNSFSYFLMEEDVPLELDEDYRTCEMPPLPPASATDCPSSKAYCRMGCICSSISKGGPIEKTHCGKPICLFECICLGRNGDGDGDDGGDDIKSRLRRRSQLLNSKQMQNDGMNSPPGNGQLERGRGTYPRMRRVPRKLEEDCTMTSGSKASSKVKKNEGIPPLVRSSRGRRKAKASKVLKKA